MFSSFARTARAKPIVSTETTTTTTAASDSQKPPPPPSLLSQYTNGHHSSPDNSNNQPQTTVIENGRSDHDLGDEIDNDDQWSDWEHDPVLPESSNEISQSILSSPPSTIQEQVLSKPVSSSSNKSLKLNNMAKSNWNSNAPLGSEYEIPPVMLNKKKSITTETSNNQDTDDFFKDMTPKVQTVELMQQLETMFYVNADQPSEQIKPTTTRTTKATVPTLSSVTTFSNKFGVM